MSTLQTRRANVQKPLRILIYGIEGVGKSTLGAKAEKPIFINIEDRVDHLRDRNGDYIQDLGVPKTFDDVVKQLNDLITKDHDFKTVVIDSIDWLERLAHSKIIGTSGKSMATVDGGYGKGFDKSAALHAPLIDLLNQLRDKKKMNIILTAHYLVKTVKDPESISDYQAFEIKCHEKVSALWREWADCVFFARFETVTTDTSNGEKTIVKGTGKRIIQTEKKPTQQAKNCFGLPPEIEFTEKFYDNLLHYVAKKSPQELEKISIEQIKKEIQEMFENVTEEQTLNTIKKSVDDANNDEFKLRAIYKRMKDLNFDKKKEAPAA